MVIFQNAMGKRILVADDGVTIHKAFALTLPGEDFALTSARSADEGLTLARQTRPDLVIADASMPGRSGYELCAALKADAALRGIPVYILSSKQQPYDEAKGRQVGADGSFQKPWDSAALIEKMRDAAGRPAGTHAPAAAAAPGARPTRTLPMAAPAPAPVHAPAPGHAPAPAAHAPVQEARPAVSSGLSATVGGLVDQKVAAISAKGPEYEALAKLSREIIEQIVWEIVPELAEAIIREQVDKRGRA